MANKQEKFYTIINNYYNTQKEEITKKFNINKDYEYNFVNENNMDFVEVYLDGKIKLKAEYDIIGMYNVPLSVWYWSWNIAFINKSLIKNILPIKDFIDVLTKKYNQFDKMEADELYYIVKNDNFYISGENLDKILKFVLYETKGIWYLPVKYTNKNKKTISDQDRIEYILITKIIQIN